MRTANPALNDSVFQQARSMSGVSADRMTISGTVNKTGILIVLLLLTAHYSWNASILETAQGLDTHAVFVPTPWLWVGMIGGFIVALITIFKKNLAPFTAPLYALFQGLFLGAISAGFEVRFPGIAAQAVLGTAGTLFALLAAYRSGMIKPTENFKLGVVAATGGIAFIYLISIIMGFFGASIPMIHDSGPIGIGFSVVVVIIAALNLVLDFDFIENGEAQGAPQFMEWYAAFGLLVTLVWLYIEFLRLISKLRSR